MRWPLSRGSIAARIPASGSLPGSASTLPLKVLSGIHEARARANSPTSASSPGWTKSGSATGAMRWISAWGYWASNCFVSRVSWASELARSTKPCSLRVPTSSKANGSSEAQAWNQVSIACAWRSPSSCGTIMTRYAPPSCCMGELSCVVRGMVVAEERPCVVDAGVACAMFLCCSFRARLPCALLVPTTRERPEQQPAPLYRWQARRSRLTFRQPSPRSLSPPA